MDDRGIFEWGGILALLTILKFTICDLKSGNLSLPVRSTQTGEAKGAH